jgi:hypothetical protein
VQEQEYIWEPFTYHVPNERLQGYIRSLKGAKDVSLLTFSIAEQTKGISVSKPLRKDTLIIGAHQNYPAPQTTFNLDGKTQTFKTMFTSGRLDNQRCR